jgi:hypothetical protein
MEFFFHPVDGGSMVLQNSGRLLPDYMTGQPRRQYPLYILLDWHVLGLQRVRNVVNFWFVFANERHIPLLLSFFFHYNRCGYPIMN